MERSQQLGREKISRLLIKFSIPAITGMLVMALYNVIDRIFIGHGVGSLGIAGITIGFPIMIIMMAFSMLIGMGAASLISIRLGQRRQEAAELIMGNALVSLVIISAVISALGIFFIDPLLKLFGASDTVLPFAREYMSIILKGAVFHTVGFGMNNFIRAEGNPVVAMMTMIIGAVINIILDPIFIFVFGWGIKGAALATVLSKIVTALWVLGYFFSRRSTLKFHWPNLKLQPTVIAGITAIGAAPFSMQLASSLLHVILNNNLARYGGDIAVSGMGVLMSIMTLIMMPVVGIGQGAQPVIGYNYGAGQFKRVKDTLKIAVAAATILVTVGYIIIMFFPDRLISMFNPHDEEMIAFGVRAIRTFMIFLPVIGLQIVGSQYFQAVGKPKQSMFLSLSRQVLILVPLLLILPRYLQLQGILISGPISDLASFILTGLFLRFELGSLEKKYQTGLELNPQPEK